MRERYGWAMRGLRNKGICLVMTLLAILLVAGCGAKTDKVKEAMKLVEEMDYQGALDVFDEAEENKENTPDEP